MQTSRFAYRLLLPVFVLGATLLGATGATAWEHDPDDCRECSRDGDCDDKNACTDDACVAGECVNTARPGCAPCDIPRDCKDGNPCTSEVCTAGICSNPPVPGCVRCEADAGCNDGDACTLDACVGTGVCAHNRIMGCRSCSSPAGCDDGNACTTEVCADGVCAPSIPIPGCTPCTEDGACNDGNPCTADACTAGACTATPIAGCQLCETEETCSDGNGCTVDICGDEGTCLHPTKPGCVPCATAAECADENPCTGDVCNALGVCEHREKEDCLPCASPADCNDSNPCSRDECALDGSCMMTFIPGCVICESDAGCNDDDTCTTDTCSEGMCTRERAEECCEPSPEICGDGVDNDCDSRTDCEDGNCEAAPSCAPKPEICGNCLDDDGNGLTDFEDAACCSARQAYPMKLRRGRILSQGPTSRVRLRSALSKKVPMHVDPRKQDVFVQLRPEGGMDILCARVPAKKFMGKRRKFKFWDKHDREHQGPDGRGRHREEERHRPLPRQGQADADDGREGGHAPGDGRLPRSGGRRGEPLLDDQPEVPRRSEREAARAAGSEGLCPSPRGRSPRGPPLPARFARPRASRAENGSRLVVLAWPRAASARTTASASVTVASSGMMFSIENRCHSSG